MAQISLDQAAAIRGVPRQTLEAWVNQGLLTLQPCRQSTTPQGVDKSEAAENVIDEEELDRIVESVGWLRLSDQGWEGTQEG
ncbi:MAG TPA: hypothetical protein VGX70_17020 [Gemmataceae bacterium]|jgi:hypothetical protein|nr:hypothetical protein [Gemmataceae bacterium]